jgi:hypothetical protein
MSCVLYTSGNGEPNPAWGLSRGDVAMDSPTVLCIDDRPQVFGASQSDS